MYATASKRHERVPSTDSTYNMLNMPIFGNICSFLSVCTVCDRLAVPIRDQLTSSKQVSPRLKMGVAHRLKAHWLNTYEQITVHHVHCFKVHSIKQIVSCYLLLTLDSCHVRYHQATLGLALHCLLYTSGIYPPSSLFFTNHENTK